ncbi:MFS transporter [Mediterraneibacter gnavus]|uniref:MFS transporter n=1 Tax=Mediterraneibacter gnavus TaxID=33038 RepID=UPI0036D275D6
MIEKRIVNWKSRTVLFLISQCVTLFGSTLVQMAIVWYVTLNTSSGVWVAAFSICSYLPQFLMSFIGGVWADRYSRKRLIIGADISIAAVTFIMMLAMPFIREEKFLLGGLLVMSIIRSVGAGIQTPAVNAVIPQLVPESQLMRFNGINATMQSLVQFAAPAAAGLLLSLSTLQSTLIIDILTAVFGVGILSCVLIPKQRSVEKSASVIKDMRMGIHFAFSDKLIRKLLIVYGLFTFLCVPAGFLAGLLVNRVYGNTYWYLTAVELIGFFGMIMGGLLMSLWRGFKSRINTLVFGLFIFGIMAVGMGLTKKFILYLILMALYGVALTIVQTSITTLIQENVKSLMQGRIFGLMGSMYSGFIPIGMVIFGPMADIIPLEWIIVCSGVLVMMIAMILRFDHQLYK